LRHIAHQVMCRTARFKSCATPAEETKCRAVAFAACRSARLSLPLIRSATLLITHASFAGLAAPPAPGAAAGGCIPFHSNAGGAVAGILTSNLATAAPVACAGALLSCSKDGSTGSSSSTFAACVLTLLKDELRGCADVSKLLEGAALAAQLACVPDTSAAAIQLVMVLLVNRFPKVSNAAPLAVILLGRQIRFVAGMLC